MANPPRRITLVSDELLGFTRTGGIGTATSFLALALGRMGHEVACLYTGPPCDRGASEWDEHYAKAGVRLDTVRRRDRRLEPTFFARMLDIEDQLASDPPDVVIVQDLAAPAYTALRMRGLGLAFPRTLFVVYCHGGRRWITDTARKVRVLPGAHAITILEQASVELADIVVSPSRYLLDWMRDERWELPDRSLVIPHLSRSTVLAEQPVRASSDGRVERIAFFGRLEDRKGIAPFIAALNSLPRELMQNVDVEFIGRATPAWPPARVRAQLSDGIRNVSFATDLDQAGALARLSRPGTLAVMPSFGETFSNAVYECLERGIPFLASNAGAPRELVDAADHHRVLFEPTAKDIARALLRALRDRAGVRPSRLGFDATTALERWREVVQTEPTKHDPQQTADEFELLIAPDDGPADHLAELLRRAQAVSGADVVTCGVRLRSGVEHMFLGDPGGLGLLANYYGTIGLVRRSLLDDNAPWPLFARLTANGAKIVSIPRALVETTSEPADIHRSPGEALRVVSEFERALPSSVRSLARLTAGLAAQARPVQPPRRRRLRRLLR